MINSTNLLVQKVNTIKANQTSVPVEYSNVLPVSGENLLENFLKSSASMNMPLVNKVEDTVIPQKPYKNNLRTMFTNNEAKILAILPRIFNAKDENGNEYIDGNEQHGTFLNAIERLDEVKAQGFNTLHILPIHPPGKLKAMGTAGSVYSPKDLLAIDPMLIDPKDPRSDREQFKAFVDACHQRGIRVMLDLPSCASYDMFLEKPELMAKERDGLAKTPQGWNDIRMCQQWEGERKRTLYPKPL